MGNELVLGILFAGTAVLTLVLLPPAIRNRRKPGAKGFAILTAGIVLWCLTAGIQFVAPNQNLAFVAANLTVLGASVASVGWLLLAVEFAGLVTMSRSVYVIAAVEPVVTQLFAWTNGWHGLFWTSMTFGLNDVIASRLGPAFYVHAAISYLFLFAATVLLLSEAITSRDARRTQSLALVAGWIPPMATTTASLTGIISLSFDPTPLLFVITAFWFSWALFRKGFLDVVPIARKTAIERMDDALVTIDGRGRIVDCNEAARQSLGTEDWTPGMWAKDFFSDYPDLVEEFRDEMNVNTEIDAEVDGERRYYQLDISPVDGADRSDRHERSEQSRFILLRDITAIKRREEALRERERDLDLMRQVLTRTLRHNIRNDLNAVQMKAEMLSASLNGNAESLVQDILTKTQDVVRASEKARRIESVIQEDQVCEFDIVMVVEDAARKIGGQYPAASITVDTPRTAYVRAHPQLPTAVTELLENAVKHSNDEAPTVLLSLDHTHPGATLVIEDNGPGIPRHELDPIENQQETALEHGSGLGLWLVQLIVDRSGATIAFEPTGDGTRASIHFPKTVNPGVDAPSQHGSV